MTPDQFQSHVIDRMGEMHEQLSDVARAASPERLEAAITKSVRAAVTDPQTWETVISVVRKQAQQEAGGWLLGGLKAAFSRALWVLVIGVGIYLLGGWTALVALFKSPHG